MARRLRRAPEQSFGARLGYRFDRFLDLHPLVQLGAVLVASFALAVVFGAGIYAVDGLAGPAGACDPAANRGACSPGGGLWWAITRMVDGGTVSNDSGSGFTHQAFGVGVTLVGLVAVSLVTGAFASSFSQRLGAVRSGLLPVFEKGHVLILGWNAHAGVVVRELARSGVELKIVILADHDREAIEESLRLQLGGRRHRLRFVIRRGDPTALSVVRRAAARRARAVLILPDPELGHCADRAALRSLLALERVLGETRARPHVIVEVLSPSGHEMVRLCEAAGHDVVVVEAHEAHARVVAQAVRQRGAFSVARQILALDELSIYLHDAGELGGLSFDEAHERLGEGILVGLVRDGAPWISPPGGTTVEPADQLLVFSAGAAPGRSRSAPRKRRRARPLGPIEPAAVSEEPLHLLVLRYRPGLAAILAFLDARGPVRATVLALPEQIAEATEALAKATLARTELELLEGDPLERAVLDRAMERPHDAALLLAPDVPAAFTPEADADQLISLLQLRHHAGATLPPRHAVVEVLSPETTLPSRLANGDDFVLSREIVGMLLARELHDVVFGDSSVFHAALDAVGPMVEVRPIDRYASGREHPAFADLAAAARRHGEVAIGIAPEHGAAQLSPNKDERFPAKGARLVVLAPREP